MNVPKIPLRRVGGAYSLFRKAFLDGGIELRSTLLFLTFWRPSLSGSSLCASKHHCGTLCRSTVFVFV